MTTVPPTGGAAEEGASSLSGTTFGFAEELVGNVPVLHLFGEVDLAAAPTLRDRLTALLEHPAATGRLGPLVVVDLAGVSFIDSTGLSVVVAAHARFDDIHGELRVAAAPERVWRVLELTGLDRLLRTYADVPSALADQGRTGS